MSMLEWEWPYKPSPEVRQTALRCATLLLILFYGEPDLIGATIQLLGRYPA